MSTSQEKNLAFKDTQHKTKHLIRITHYTQN